MQPLALIGIAMSHMLVNTAFKKLDESSQCSGLVRVKSKAVNSWILVPEAGFAPLDHVLVHGRWRLVQNCSDFRSAESADFSWLP